MNNHLQFKPQIIYEIRNVYGNLLNYPVNYKEEIETLTGQKTINGNHIKALRKMGFDVYSKEEYFLACQNALNGSIN